MEEQHESQPMLRARNTSANNANTAAKNYAATGFPIWSRASLLRGLRRVIRAALFFLNILYGGAVVLLLLGFGIFSFLEWVAQHFGFAIGEGVCIVAALAWLQTQYMRTHSFLKRAQAFLKNPKLDDDLFDIISYALKYYANKAWDGVSIVTLSWFAPLAVKAPDYIASRTYNYNYNNTIVNVPPHYQQYLGAVRVLVGICAAILGFVATKLLENARAKSLQTIEDVVDHVDDMPEFDWVDKYSGDDSDSDDDGSYDGLVA